MLKSFYNSKVEARFILCENELKIPPFDKSNKYLRIIWNRSKRPMGFLVDDKPVILLPHNLICLTYLQNIRITDMESGYSAILFNPEFYCIHTNDKEVSCNGLLFFGSDATPVISLDKNEATTLDNLFSTLKEEFDTIDNNQEEMLRILLKRLIIRCTRLARKQWFKNNVAPNDIDIIRQFIIHVEEHYKSLHRVGDYAVLMNKSAKTITNTFSLFSDKTPLQIIHGRIILEAKRQLLYTDKPLKQIGYELGFDDPSQFSKLFKNIEGKNAVNFRKNHLQTSFGQF